MSVLQAVDREFLLRPKSPRVIWLRNQKMKNFTVILTATYIHFMATRAYITKMVTEYITIEFSSVHNLQL